MELNARVGRQYPRPCLRCGGTGRTEVVTLAAHSSFAPPPVFLERCSICQGTGAMPSLRTLFASA